ncbi:uncharacterized protein KY384_003706 [Bacidia gigantensis]|uniref:uncharacterized protein n=1 Tax=Bacidia gigantensis TaxID=2732470 RepID=UPI001D048ACE|nr:uncharacterized protein KY384_003706 [Bacidia gigantensis]KAG8532069.1 hypothetical protein KY384_003706 [Bacidia gigantensis]
MRLSRAPGSPTPNGYFLAQLYTIIILTILSLHVVGFELAKEDFSNTQDPSSGDSSFIERYLPDFFGADRSIIGRASDDIQSLSNNAPGRLNIDPGKSQFWTFPKTAWRPGPPNPRLPSTFDQCQSGNSGGVDQHPELKKRQERQGLFVTINTCGQPNPTSPSASTGPDQLQLYISTSAGNQRPDANNHDHEVSVSDGYGSTNPNDPISISGDVYIGVAAPASSSGFSGNYNYEITASIDDLYAKTSEAIISRFVDGDNHGAIVHTNNVTSCNATGNPAVFSFWKDGPPPYSIFVSTPDDPQLQGLSRSMCALKSNALVSEATDVDRSIINTKDGGLKQQFVVKSLNASTSYLAVVALEGTSGKSDSIGGGKINGGGTVWGWRNFTTKSADTCALLTGLEFCSDVAYAVPYNPDTISDLASLSRFYDDQARSLNENFVKSMAQIACDTTASAQYSLAVTCDDCKRAYKDWLCAVTIPRCEDSSNDGEHLQPRGVRLDGPLYKQGDEKRLSINRSRNPLIDEKIQPGTYKELLPCQDLCYDLVRSCPAALGFSCPLERAFTFNLRRDGWITFEAMGREDLMPSKDNKGKCDDKAERQAQ